MSSCDIRSVIVIEADQESPEICKESRKRRRSSEDEIFINDVPCSVTTAPVSKKEKSTESTSKPEQEGTDSNSAELYGLKPEYLKMLGIIPPLNKWVNVSNFRCDKSDLRDVLELAGHVVTCSVITHREKYAKVLYRHPLEAVQAISMLHNQKFYGQLLKVTMLPCMPGTILLPKGLTDIGPGLGIGGKPVRDIVKEYEKFIDKKQSSLNSSVFFKTSECPTKCEDDNKTDEASLKTIDSWDGEWIVKDEIKDDLSEDSVEFKLDKFSKKRRFRIRNVEESDDSNGFDNMSGDENSPPLEAPGLSSFPTEYKEIQRCASQSLPKRANSVGSNTTQGSSKSVPVLNFRSTIPETTARRCPEPQNSSFLPNPPGLNSSSGYDSRSRPIPPISNPTATPVICSNAPNFMASGIVTNSVGPPRLGGPIQGSNVAAPNPMIRNDSRYVPRPIRGPVPSSNNVVGSSIPIISSRPTASGPRPGLTMPITGPIVPNPMVGPRPNLGGPMPNGPMIASNAPMGLVKTPTLEFRNLPPSTTFAILCAKMSECGQVLSIQMTTPGCAIVKYTHVSHADICFPYHIKVNKNQLVIDKWLEYHRIPIRGTRRNVILDYREEEFVKKLKR